MRGVVLGGGGAWSWGDEGRGPGGRRGVVLGGGGVCFWVGEGQAELPVAIMQAPPPKRLRGEEGVVDSFGDDEDFTQDELDEIDIISSQAIRPLPLARPTANHSRGNPAGRPGAEDRGDYLSLLETQHSELREKLKEVEEQVVVKEGEIRLLRDSLRGVQQEKEVQKEQRLLREQQEHKEQQEKEKELLKKIQSLQAELHFKEAEINNTRSKLVKISSPLPRNRMPGSSTQVHHGNSSPSPTGSSFITKERFAAQLPPKTTPTGPDDTTLPAEPTAPVRADGVGLLSFLLQPYLSPSSLSLCHLLMGPTRRPEQQVQEDNLDCFSLIQNLAMTGLNMLTHKPAPTSTRTHRWCPGALHLLPLLDHHLKELCDSLGSRGGAAGGGGEEAGRSVEERGLAALRVLHLLLAHSDEVVERLLQPETRVATEQTSQAAGAGVVVRMVRLCDPGFCSPAERKELLVHTALRSLRVLVERTPHTLSHRLQDVCWLQAVSVCVSAEGFQVVSECVSLLRCAADHELLAAHLCSTHESCVFLRLFHYIRTRPEPLTIDWTLLDLQVVQTVVVVVHRQWLELRDRQTSPPVAVGGPQWAVLREALLLLHWLLGNHGGFSEGCRAVLHLYHQLVPALRDAMRTIPTNLSYSEELALEEVCRSEADDTDDMDTETGS
ncbi:ATR-interacting protein [Merluccius polli]|uniref:ATR-interacting protein n=1 Tax=Merluccius polli TaxID=89951 RepID=A0AA47MT77_MERPO|nr:ATR-interacting protein [Merluccius polli]